MFHGLLTRRVSTWVPDCGYSLPQQDKRRSGQTSLCSGEDFPLHNAYLFWRLCMRNACLLTASISWRASRRRRYTGSWAYGTIPRWSNALVAYVQVNLGLGTIYLSIYRLLKSWTCVIVKGFGSDHSWAWSLSKNRGLFDYSWRLRCSIPLYVHISCFEPSHPSSKFTCIGSAQWLSTWDWCLSLR